jgi:hypothetical protein
MQAALLVENELTNPAAMARLHAGFAGTPKRRYFPNPNVEPDSFDLPGLPEVRVHMLGPIRDRNVVKDTEPPAAERWFSALTNDDDTDTLVTHRLFDPVFLMSPEDIRRDYHDLYLTKADRAKLATDVTLDALAAAALVSNTTNNTSLFFVLEIQGTKLLFPGDAQWGLWRIILNDTTNQELLRDTTLYKVGHHGSGNATHTRYVRDLMGTKTTSLMSFHPVAVWKSIPNSHLVDALEQSTRVLVRSDTTTRKPHVQREGTLVSEHTLTLA